jgi:hypothetical protein
MDAKVNDFYIYFPLECAISKEFLSFTNSFRDKELNQDKEKTGLFEQHGRVRAAKIRGEKSEGYIVPVKSIEEFIKFKFDEKYTFTSMDVGTDFDLINDLVICQKYIPHGTRTPGLPGSKKTKGNIKRYESKLVENQWHFHPDTGHLKREILKIKPTDLISISNKLHGCNFSTGNLLTKIRLPWWKKQLQKIGIPILDKKYDMLYASRSVLKNSTLHDDKEHNHFYDADVWKIVADRVFPFLKDGITVYGEIYGYTPTGRMIQKGYDYGCKEGELDYVVFRITYTNDKGDVFEFSHNQVQEYCKSFGIKTPKTYYYGFAKDLFPELDVGEHWHENFLIKMMETYLEKDCHLCKSKPNIPEEGIILRNDSKFDWEVYKLKSFRFLQHESAEIDKGEVDMETAETQQEENGNVAE